VKRMGLALALSLIGVLTLLPGPTWAGDRHRTSAGCCVFIGPGHSSVIRHGFISRHGFIHPLVGPTFIVGAPVPQPALVWVPGFWWWNGFQWVWSPDHWAVAGQRALLRNPYD
jgi:hypothetical protein